MQIYKIFFAHFYSLILHPPNRFYKQKRRWASCLRLYGSLKGIYKNSFWRNRWYYSLVIGIIDKNAAQYRLNLT